VRAKHPIVPDGDRRSDQKGRNGVNSPKGARRNCRILPVTAGRQPSEDASRTRTPAGPAVIVTDGGNGQNRSTVAAVRALAQAGYRPVLTRSSPLDLAATSRATAMVETVPAVGDPGYADAVAALRARTGAVAVLPASDASLLALGGAGAHLVDKSQLRRDAAAAGFPALREWRAASVADLESLGVEYPVVVKAERKQGAGSFEARRLTSVADAAALPAGVPVVAQQLVEGPLTAVAGVMWRGRLLAVVHQRAERLWPPECGVASAAVTRPRDPELEARLVDLLAGFEGIFQAQLIDGHLLDLNPRVYGSLPLAVASGANLPAIWCDALVDIVPRATVVGRSGVRYRWLEGDLRSIVAARRSGRSGAGATVAALRPHRGTAHSIESLRDPGPFVARLRFAARNAGG
jgi:hypothetical protein